MSLATGHIDPTSSIRALRSVQLIGRGFDASITRMASISCSLTLGAGLELGTKGSPHVS
jgi:hypothetical protein